MNEPLNALKDLPENYHSVWKFDITRTREIIILNIIGLSLFFLSIWGFNALAQLLRPEFFQEGFSFTSQNLSEAFSFLIELLLATVIMLLVHEGLHGLFFWIFSGSRPKFAFKIYYASACAPGWYFPRWQYMIIGLAPLVVITLIGVAGLAWFPSGLLFPTQLILIFNTSGAVGDLWVTGQLLRFPPTTYILDSGDASEFFVKNA